jgi:hypothetical protein
VLVVGGLFAYTQPDAYRIFFAIFTAGTGGLPVVSKALAFLDTRKTDPIGAA